MTLLQFEVYLYNDEIIREGTIGRKMFFISRGTVRIVNAKTQTHTLTDGAFFGEISLILPNLRRVASVIVINMCLEGETMSCSDFLEFLTSDRIS